MGLRDFFRPAVDKLPLPTKEDWLRIGRLEAQVESLVFQWDAYRDELRKLVQRLEKRDLRADQREKAAAAETTPPKLSEHELLEKARRRHALRRGL